MGLLYQMLESAWSAMAANQVPQGVSEPGVAAAVSTGLFLALIWVAGVCVFSILLIMLPTIFRRRQPGH